MNTSSIANIIADENTESTIKNILKELKKCKKIIRGKKAVEKAIKRNKKGVILFNGNFSPLDLIIHIPILCEEKSLPYLFVKDRNVLRSASLKNNLTTCCFVEESENDKYKEIINFIKK
ncbi:Ribosomal protein L7Ae/L30e/S12e/Gadd45 family [Spraguea lophii 42_110]|uniref:Ribosomal protein L7Ae/L30e/S12e/Gadd45 family n=1 Tax=Spraguea lophii (strain 42_110) TaxID=1358809 RepID=S7XST4_SPRLO|nr:Ribosomal protein L7Ae/L30e/S12e/Gadd45 family [Spraguea lophii 42_110]